MEWETVRVRFVKAASKSRLVEALATDDGELESTFINVFLATYRTFARPDEVLELLIQRYDRLHSELLHLENVADQHKKTLGNLIYSIFELRLTLIFYLLNSFSSSCMARWISRRLDTNNTSKTFGIYFKATSKL